MNDSMIYRIISESAPVPSGGGFADVLARIERQRGNEPTDTFVPAPPVKARAAGKGFPLAAAAAVAAAVGLGAAGVVLLSNSAVKSEDAECSTVYEECEEPQESFEYSNGAADEMLLSDSDVSDADAEQFAEESGAE